MANRSRQKGWMFCEVIISIGIIGIMMLALYMLLGSTRKFNHYQLARQQCMVAGQTQLDSISQTGASLTEEAIQRLWPDITLETEYLDGKEQWQGMKLVRVKAATYYHGRKITIVQGRYIESGREVK